jgi:hypothetical protein
MTGGDAPAGLGRKAIAPGCTQYDFSPRLRRQSRILIVSCRQIRHAVFNSALYEFEDAVASYDEADFFAPTCYHGDRRFDIARSTRRLWRGVRGTTSGTFPFPIGFRPEHDYDLLFLTVDNPWDLDLVHLVRGARKRCAKIVAYLPELWSRTFESRLFRYEPFNLFDHFFVGTAHSVKRLEALTGVPTSSLAPAVDALAFAPLTSQPPRVIDVINLGRRIPEAHTELLAMAARGAFYLYSNVANGDYPEATTHRQWLADLLRRSRFSIANFARADLPDFTRGARELGFRHPEGAAAGTVMLGVPPTSEDVGAYFGWPDAVIPLPADASGIADVIADLDRDPSRQERIRRTNIAGALRCHDWVHRWFEVLAAVGLEPTQSMEDRRGEVLRLADGLGS